MAKKRADTRSLVAGRNPVREALEAGEGLEKLYLQNGIDGRLGSQLRAMAKEAGVPVQSVPPQRLESLVPGVNHQGVVLLLAEVDYLDVDDMLREIAPEHDDVKTRKPLILLLDGIQDPHNLGAILRTAVAVGVAGVILPMRGAAAVTTAAVKTSAGLARHIPIARVLDVKRTITQLKERGYWIAGADGAGEVTVWEMDWDRATVLVMGSESDGMQASVAKSCDYRVSIPMPGSAESLNVSVAAGILLYSAVRCRL